MGEGFVLKTNHRVAGKNHKFVGEERFVLRLQARAVNEQDADEIKKNLNMWYSSPNIIKRKKHVKPNENLMAVGERLRFLLKSKVGKGTPGRIYNPTWSKQNYLKNRG